MTIRFHEPEFYNKQLFEKFRYPFKGFEHIEKNYSQVYQDLFVLAILDGKTHGSYLEIGGGNPFWGSNTALLEKLGWAGVTIECDNNLAHKWKSERTRNTLLHANAKKLDYRTEVMPYYGSTTIDYLQLDIDPAVNTFDVLKMIPFDTHRFNVITYEHDAYAENGNIRQLSRDYLEYYNYTLVAGNISPDDNSPFEDWWVGPGLSHLACQKVDMPVVKAQNYMFNR